ncbi:MAG: extracellular solute-binding protein [Clostridia bacterium]|nr:extracellular solute-binding protein [Clostridia bacterium]NLS84597.1 extracellular solute-binding protein [Oscillospiraceae bacterium]
MKSTRKALSLVLAGTMIASSLLTGCGSSTSTAASTASSSAQASSVAAQTTKDMRVGWWGSQSRHDATISVFDTYGKLNNVNFTYEYNSYDSYWETLATQSVGGHLPDVIQQVTDQFSSYINSGLLVDLQPYVDSGVIDTSDIDDVFLSGGEYKGGLYGISLGTNVMTIMYNPELFKAAGVDEPKDGWAWSDFVKTARDIYAATGVQTENVAVGMPRYLFEAMIRSKGQALYSEDGKDFGFDDETKAELIQVLQDCYDLTTEGVFVDPEEQILWSDNSERAFCKGEAAMAMNWSSSFVNFSGQYNLTFDMTTQPVLDDATTQGMYMRPAQFFSVTTSSKDPEAAAAAINYFVNDLEANTQTLKGERGVPINTTIRTTLRDSSDETTQKVYDFISDVSEFCRDNDPSEPAASRQCVEVLNNNVNEVMYGQMTAEDCINDWMQQSIEILGA